MKVLTLTQITELRPIGNHSDPTARLLAQVAIAGVRHHMEAIAVTYIVEMGEQVAAVMDDQGVLDDIRNATGGDGPWETVEINGREYVICITPYCQ